MKFGLAGAAAAALLDAAGWALAAAAVAAGAAAAGLASDMETGGGGGDGGRWWLRWCVKDRCVAATAAGVIGLAFWSLREERARPSGQPSGQISTPNEMRPQRCTITATPLHSLPARWSSPHPLVFVLKRSVAAWAGFEK